MDALIGFARWFWLSHLGGLAWYMEQDPTEWDSPEQEAGFAQDDAMLKKVVNACLPYFKGNELVKTFPRDVVVQVVRMAWEDCFSDIPPLTEDPGYEAWKKRILGPEPKEGHKICRACWKSFPYDARFCHYCGGQLPDQLFSGSRSSMSPGFSLRMSASAI